MREGLEQLKYTDKTGIAIRNVTHLDLKSSHHSISIIYTQQDITLTLHLVLAAFANACNFRYGTIGAKVEKIRSIIHHTNTCS
jgi:hypothetical protein